MNRLPFASYLPDLAREVRTPRLFEPRIPEQTSGHVLEAVEAGRHRGLTVEAEEREAFPRCGAPRIAAARFDRARHRMLNLVLIMVAVAPGIATANADSRSGRDDAGITAFSILLGAGEPGFIGLQCPSLWTRSVGNWIPLHGITSAPTMGLLVGGIVILTFPTVGAYDGMAHCDGVAMVWGSQAL